MKCPRCGMQDCRVAVVKKPLPKNVRVITTKWCRHCWWQEEQSENLPPEKAYAIEGVELKTP